MSRLICSFHENIYYFKGLYFKVKRKYKRRTRYFDIFLKDEYIGRYNERGNDDNFIKILGENWDNWINDIEKQKGCLKIKLQSGEFLGDFIK
jgi:hypothetical protein